MAAKVKRLILLPSPKLRPRGKEVLCCFTSAITYIIAILSALSLQLHAAPGAIKSDAEVQGLPCDGVCRQGKPCTPGVISIITECVCITFNRTRHSQLLFECKPLFVHLPCGAFQGRYPGG